MTAQEVIKNFMAALDSQNYSSGITALDDAVRKSSRFDGIQDALNNFLADQKTVEQSAIKTILGSNYKSDYDGLQLSDLLTMAETDSALAAALAEEATYSDTPKNYGTGKTFSATERIRMLTADTFLKDYCGIELERYIFHYNGVATYYQNYSTGNVDTGAITGSDAGGDTVKTSNTVVQEIGNMYTASTSAPQNISTGTNDWIVKATDADDTIYSGGADSIDAGNGADFIYVEGDAATIKTGAADNYSDNVTISESVKNVTVENLEQFDTLNISGDFKVAAASLDSDNDKVTIHDSTGNRTFIINGWTTAQNSAVVVNGETLTLGKWLSAFVDYTETSSTETALTSSNSESPVIVNLSDVSSIGGAFTLAGGARQANYNATATSGVGTVSTEFPNLTTFTTRGLTVELGDTSATLTTAQQTIFEGLFKWWIKEGLKLNEVSYNLGFTTDGVRGKNIKVFFYNENSNTLAYVNNSVSNNQVYLNLYVNMTRFSNISAADENGAAVITSGGNSATYNLDRTVAHELNHAIAAANISNFN